MTTSTTTPAKKTTTPAKKTTTSSGSRSYDSGPPAPVPSTDAGPIGVPKDYQFQIPFWSPGGSGAAQVAPKYFPGNENTEVVGLAPEDIAGLQASLRDLGLITKGSSIRLGVWDATSAEGFRQVLAWANANGLDWKQALADMKQSGTTFGPAAAPSRQATNPLDFQALGDQTAKSRLGRGLTTQEEQQFAAKASATEAPYLPADVTVSEPGSVGWQKWAETQVREFDPTKFDSRKVVDKFDVLAKMMSGS